MGGNIRLMLFLGSLPPHGNSVTLHQRHCITGNIRRMFILDSLEPYRVHEQK